MASPWTTMFRPAGRLLWRAAPFALSRFRGDGVLCFCRNRKPPPSKKARRPAPAGEKSTQPDMFGIVARSESLPWFDNTSESRRLFICLRSCIVRPEQPTIPEFWRSLFSRAPAFPPLELASCLKSTSDKFDDMPRPRESRPSHFTWNGRLDP